MSGAELSVGSSTGAPITFSGLASGLDTSSIIKALMEVEREPVKHLTQQETKIEAQQATLGSIQSDLEQLSFAASEFALPSLYETSQTATSSEPLRVSAVTTGGAGIGGYEVEVTQLANAAQRTFTFTAPKAEQTISIDGTEFTIKAGASAKELANKINASSSAPVYAAALENGTIVLSNRATGSTEGKFIEVSGAGTTLEEVSSKEGKNAEYSVDGVAATSSSNTVTTAIPGVTLTFAGTTTHAGAVTIDVQAPAANVSKVEAQVKSFLTLYNSTVEAIETQLTTKPPKGVNEEGVGTLFGDQELTEVLTRMRRTMYEPIVGLASELSSPSGIGLNTGAPNGASATQSSVEGILTFDPSKLAEAMAKNPSGVSKMLEQWAGNMQGLLSEAGGPGGALENRITGEAAEIKRLTTQIGNMNEMLALREHALQQTYAEVEALISQNTSASESLLKQSEALTAQKL